MQFCLGHLTIPSIQKTLINKGKQQRKRENRAKRHQTKDTFLIDISSMVIPSGILSGISNALVAAKETSTHTHTHLHLASLVVQSLVQLCFDGVGRWLGCGEEEEEKEGIKGERVEESKEEAKRRERRWGVRLGEEGGRERRSRKGGRAVWEWEGRGMGEVCLEGYTYLRVCVCLCMYVCVRARVCICVYTLYMASLYAKRPFCK